MIQGICAHCGEAIARKSAERIIAETQMGRIGRSIALTLAEHFGTWVSRERLATIVYADDPDGGPENASVSIASTIAQTVRPRLAEHGIAIDYRTGSGNRMRWSDAK